MTVIHSMPNAADFREEFAKLREQANREGHRFFEVTGGQLHRLAGGYPGRSHRMPVCCGVMLSEMRPGDELLEAPPSLHGASLKIRYIVR